jgi:hypothetical protein
VLPQLVAQTEGATLAFLATDFPYRENSPRRLPAAADLWYKPAAMRANKRRRNAHGSPCPYCQRPMERHHPKLEPTRDHVMPQSRNGKEIIIVCLQCNMIKADMLPDQWAIFMETNPGWWLLSKADLRAARRGVNTPGLEAHRNDRRERKARLARQGSPPAKPVVVPPELIWTANQLRPYERAMVLLQAERDATRQEQAVSIDEPQPPPSQSDEACPQ